MVKLGYYRRKRVSDHDYRFVLWHPDRRIACRETDSAQISNRRPRPYYWKPVATFPDPFPTYIRCVRRKIQTTRNRPAKTVKRPNRRVCFIAIGYGRHYIRHTFKDPFFPSILFLSMLFYICTWKEKTHGDWPQYIGHVLFVVHNIKNVEAEILDIRHKI